MYTSDDVLFVEDLTDYKAVSLLGKRGFASDLCTNAIRLANANISPCKVISITLGYNATFTLEDEGKNRFNSKCFIPLKFNIGDEVKVISDEHGYQHAGECGVIKAMEGNSVGVLFQDNDLLWYDLNEIESPMTKNVIGEGEDSVYSRIRDIAYHYGRKLQTLKCCEECAELIQALLKDDSKHIAEEIADVEIMTEQIKELNGIRDIVEQFKEMKIQRQLARMQNEGVKK